MMIKIEINIMLFFFRKIFCYFIFHSFFIMIMIVLSTVICDTYGLCNVVFMSR